MTRQATEPTGAPQLLWTPRDKTSTKLWRFKQIIENKYHVQFSTYEDLRQWSINNIAKFWSEVWYFTGVQASEPFSKVVEDKDRMFPRPVFFEGAKLNFAQNLLYPECNPSEDLIAIIAATEQTCVEWTWKRLREEVRLCANAMRKSGIKSGDRVAGFVTNHAFAVVAMLSATSLGAIWTGVSPDHGVTAVLDRIEQIEPKILFADNASLYNGKVHDSTAKISEICRVLSKLEVVVIFNFYPGQGRFEIPEIATDHDRWKACRYGEFIASVQPSESLEFAQLPADHPIYILYSSGTTGRPKCIVHGAIGTLIQHKKEHDIQSGIGLGDRLCYYTTCSWMMWHWLVSGLASGATIVLYDGSPFVAKDRTLPSDLAMPCLLEELGITHFGTSAKYLSMLEQKFVRPKKHFPLGKLRAIYSTGSPLAPSTFDYIYDAFGPDINLASITGGTDIISLFGAPSQVSPVYRGEIQVRGLGMAVEVWDFEGKDITATGEPGDLVCTKPFPCQPVAFWGPDGSQKYERSYFETFPGVWHHGDFIRINPETGGLVMLGRSDGVLKPSGVRFGSSEIYNVLLRHFPQIEDALCIGRRREYDIDETVILFVKMAQESFSQELAREIQKTIRAELSSRHVPAIVDECPEIPVTTNGKKVEIVVKQILSGFNVKTSASVANVECLDWYREWGGSH